MKDRHHLLECILWPNGDGTFRKIINRSKRLKALGVYRDFKLTVELDHGVHSSMHRQFEEGTEFSVHKKGKRAANWRGGASECYREYKNALALFKEGKITEEEFKPFRKNWCSYVKEKNRLRKHGSESRV